MIVVMITAMVVVMVVVVMFCGHSGDVCGHDSDVYDGDGGGGGSGDVLKWLRSITTVACTRASFPHFAIQSSYVFFLVVLVIVFIRECKYMVICSDGHASSNVWLCRLISLPTQLYQSPEEVEPHHRHAHKQWCLWL